MNPLLTILLLLVGIIALVLIIASFMRKDHYIQRDIIVDVPRPKVFEFIKLLKNQESWNKWAMVDPGRTTSYEGEDGTIGFTISWSGNKEAGEGKKEIMNIEDGKSMESQIRFTKPMETTANVVLDTEMQDDNRTKIIMSNAGTLKYPMNLFIPMAEKKFPKDMDASLAKLKEILEREK